MSPALRRLGLLGVGLSELLQGNNARKSVHYRHFPSGKTELAAVAIEDALERVVGSLAQPPNALPDPVQGLDLSGIGRCRVFPLS